MTAERHAVADLLTPEMRERVRMAEFRRDRSGISAQDDDNDHEYRRCPLAVAAGVCISVRWSVYRALGISRPNAKVESFMEWADAGDSDPADVYVMLGCSDGDS